MSERQRELYNTIEDIGASEELIIKDKEELINKLSEGIEDTEKGNLVDSEDVFSEVGKILAK